MTATLTESQLDLPLLARGKVRDIYDLDDKLLIVATDRLSAFDVVFPAGIPDKGLVLTQLSAFWFERTGDIVPNHFIRLVDSTRIDGVPVELPREMIGRAMLVRKAERIDVECVVEATSPDPAGPTTRRPGDLRQQADGGDRGEPGTAGAHLHTDNQGARGPRHAHHHQAGRRPGRSPAANAMKVRSLAIPLRPRLRPRARHHHRRHKVRVRLARRRDHPHR